MIQKYIQDGKVAVLVSPGFGAGWSTWNYDYPQMLFDPTIVKMILDQEDNLVHQIVKYSEEMYPDGYFGGADDLEVIWIPEGTAFRVHEYDGSETIEIKEEMAWTIA